MQQVRSTDPNVRREAIINMGKLGDARALSHLAQVYKTDPDPALRDLAAKAGRHIQRLQKEAQGNAAPNPVASPPAPPPAPPPVEAEPPRRSNLPDILSAYTRPPDTPAAPPTPPVEEDIDDLLSSLSDDSPVGNRDYAYTPVVEEEEPPRRESMPDILAAYRRSPDASVPAVPNDGERAVAAGSGASAVDAAAPRQPRPSGGLEGGSAGKSAEIDLSKAKPVSQQQVQRAKTLLNAAFVYKTKGDDDNALAELAKAVRINPMLANDPGALGLAASLIGGSGKTAMAVVLQKSQDKEILKHKGAKFDVEIIDVVLSMVFLFVIVTLFSLALFYGAMAITTAVYAMMMPSSVRGSMSVEDMRTMFQTFTLQAILPDVLRLAAVTIGSTLFQTIIIYVVGLSMGGIAVFLKFARAMTNIQIVIYILWAVALGVGVMGVFSGSMSTFRTMAQIALLLLGLAAIGGLGVQSWIAGRQHDIGFVRGLVSILVGTSAAGFIANALGLFNINP